MPIITFTGPSGSGKTEVLKCLSKLNEIYQIVPKYTNRPHRKDDDSSIIAGSTCPDTNNPEIISYQQYGFNYWFYLKDVDNALNNNKIPILIINDVDALKKIQNLYDQEAKSFFIHRQVPSREQFERMIPTRGQEFSSQINDRLDLAIKIYNIYTNNINLFNRIILNTGESISILQEFLKMLSDNIITKNIHPRFTSRNTHKLFVIAGNPGSGKDKCAEILQNYSYSKFIPKYTDRKRNIDDNNNFIFCPTEKDFPNTPTTIKYTNYSNHYAFDIETIRTSLRENNNPHILVCSNIEAIKALKESFDTQAVVLYVHSDMSPIEYKQERQALGDSDNYINQRVAAFYLAAGDYLKNFALFDGTLVHSKEPGNLSQQLSLLMGLNIDLSQKLGVDNFGRII